MSDVISVQDAAQTVLACEVCGRSGAVPWYCKNCQGSICDSCKAAHKEIAISSRHSVVPRTGEVLRLHGPAKLAKPCLIHKTKDISSYCKTCKIPCCVNCLSERHKQHDFSPIEKVYLSAERRLNDYIKQVNEQVKPELDDKAIQAKNKSKEIFQAIENVKGDINVFRKHMKDAVDCACDSMIERVEKPDFDLRQKVRKVESERKRVDELVSQITEMIREGKIDIIEYTPPDLASLVPQIIMPQTPNQEFIPNKDIIKFIQSNMGKTLAWKFTPIVQFKITAEVTAITTAGYERAWMIGKNTMYLYSDMGTLITSVTMRRGGGVHDMVITPSGDMIITTVDKKVRRKRNDMLTWLNVKLNKYLVASPVIDTAPFTPAGACLTTNGELVVCMSGQGEGNHVAIYSSDVCETYNVELPKKQDEIIGIDDHGNKLITDPYRVVQNGEDLCVVNKEKNVVCIDTCKRGHVRWVYDGTQAKLEKAFAPHGICNDKYFNLLVTDSSNHCVHYLHREGQLKKVILTEKETGLQRHWGICMTDDQVWVGNNAGDFVVAKYMYAE